LGWEMRVSVVRPADLGPSEAGTWAKFQQNSPLTLSAFFSLTFAQATGRSRPNARVAVIEDNGQIEAFLPFEVSAAGPAIPIGYPMNDLHGFIGSGAPIDARWVIRKAGLRGWRFISAPTEQQPLVSHHYRGTVVQVPVINLRTGYESQLSQRRKSRRALERELGPISFEWHSCRPDHLRQLLEWKARKYGGTRKLFSTDPTAYRVVEELAAAANEDCRGVVGVLYAGEQPVAAHLGLLGPWALSGWFMSYDPGLNRFAPGMMMWSPLAEAAAEHGIPRIDLGYGQDAYKFGLANDSYQVAGGAVWSSRSEAAARSIYRRLREKASSRLTLSAGKLRRQPPE
jgi:CelD/BcsL family acetyltransferase involved in cellulose biosynthesis